MIKRIFALIAAVAPCAVQMFAQSEYDQPLESASSTPIGSTSIGSILLGIAILLVALAAIGHMIYVLMIRPKLRTDWTSEEMMAARQAAGLSPESSDEENEMAYEFLQQQIENWETWRDEDGEENALPLSRANVKAAAEAYAQGIAVMPTDPELLDMFNQFGDTVNEMRKRVFTASKTMLVVLAICCVLVGLGGNVGVAIGFGLTWGILYSLACMKPNYVLIRKELEGKQESSFLTGIIAGLLGGIAAAPTYRTVTTYSDGSTTTEDDHSATWFSIIFMVIVAVFLVVIMPIVSLINYLRNYVFA